MAKAKSAGAKRVYKKSRKESDSIYVYKVLKQVHPDTGVSSKAGVGKWSRSLDQKIIGFLIFDQIFFSWIRILNFIFDLYFLLWIISPLVVIYIFFFGSYHR